MFAGYTGDECEKLLLEAQVAHARQRDMSEVASHPQLVERGRWTSIDTPAGPIEAVLPPVTMSGVEYRMDPIPAVGEHTDAILAGIGRTPEQIAALHTEGTV